MKVKAKLVYNLFDESPKRLKDCFCVAHEARSTHRDRNSFVVVRGVTDVTLLVSDR